MNDKIILLIDMDGVICHWYENLYRIYRARYPDRMAIKPEDVTQFYVEELYPEEHRDDVVAIARERGFYADLRPVPGALEALKDIQENCTDFIEPFICSSPEVEYEDMACHSEKAAWVEDVLGNWWTKKLILTKDKTLVRGHILIDDKPEITGALKPIWLHMLFDQPYNRLDSKLDIGDMRQRFTWSDWPALRKFLENLVLKPQSEILLAS
jgi:5'-nucleotidase